MEQKNQKKCKIMNKISLFEKKILETRPGASKSRGVEMEFSLGKKTKSLVPIYSENSSENDKLVSGNSYNHELPCVFSYIEKKETRLIHRFIKFITKKGKKSTAESILSKTFYLLVNKMNKNSEGPKVYSTVILGKSRKSSNQEFLSNKKTSGISLDQKFPGGNENGLNYKSKVFSKSDMLPARAPLALAYALEASEPISIFTIINKAIDNVKPFFEVKKVRVAGTTVQVPSLVQPNRQESLAINWILQSAFERKKKNPSQTFENCLALEIYEAFLKQGQARNKRNELHKLAEANRAFSHFRWW